MFEHHRARPNLPHRIGDGVAVYVWRRAVNRFEQRGEFALGVYVRRGRYANSAGARRAKIRQDVAEQVGADHDVEPVPMHAERRRQRVKGNRVRFCLPVTDRHRLATAELAALCGTDKVLGRATAVVARD